MLLSNKNVGTKNDDYVIICPNISKKLFHKNKVHLDTTFYGVLYEEKEENLNEVVD